MDLSNAHSLCPRQNWDIDVADTVRSELSGATFGSRLKTFVCENSGIKFDKHIAFLDSRIVQEMIGKNSYGFNTFAALRIGEIQQKSDPKDWLPMSPSF